jgi:hypothetical protein
MELSSNSFVIGTEISNRWALYGYEVKVRG